MIDRESRDKAAHLMAQFQVGGLTNDQFEDAWPSSHDRALKALSTMIWGLYDDRYQHALEGSHA